EAMEDVGELDRDVTAAGDQDRLRQLLKIERLVGGDRVLAARQRMVRIGPAAGRNQDVASSDGATVLDDTDRVRPLDHRPALDDLGARVFQPAPVETFQPSDLLVLVGDKRLPVETGFTDGPAVSGRILEMLGELGGVDE